MTDPAQALADIIARPAPVIFFDTCALLDLIRATDRDAAADIAAANNILVLAAADRPHLFIQDLVPVEYAAHTASARDDGSKGVRVFAATWAIAAGLAHPVPPPPAPSLTTLVDELALLSANLLAACTVLGRDYDGMSWAMDRVAAKKKPSNKSGTVKDCHIVGHAITLSRQLRSGGFSKSRLFVSSNTTDFAGRPSTALHQDLVADFTSAGLRYAVSIADAVAQLRASGEM